MRAGAAGAVAALAAAAALTAAGCGRPAEPTRAPTPAAPGAGPVRADGRIAVAPSADGTAVAAAFVVPGSAWEGAASSGLTLLAARAALEDARDPLTSLGAVAAVSCDRAAFTFTLVAPAETWDSALERFTAAVFRADPSEAGLERARAALLASLRLDHASPAWQARLAPRRALHDDGSGDPPWARPACGVPETLAGFRVAEVRRTAARFRAAEATAAVVGPVVPDSVLRTIRTELGAAPPPRFPAPEVTGPGRVYVERNTVTAWVALAWPFGPGADVEALRLLAAVLEDGVAPGVDRPEIFHAGHEVERHGGGGALIVHLVVAPERAAAVTRALEAQVARTAWEGANPAVLERVRRRHQGARLRELAAPEARAARLARELALGPPAGSGAPALTEWPDPRSVTGRRLRQAAAALGPPARAVVGPRAARTAVLP